MSHDERTKAALEREPPPQAPVGNTSPPPVDHPDAPLMEGEEAPPRGVRRMAIVRWALVALMAFAALAAFNMKHGWIGGAASGESDIIYYCPMHPSVQQDHPGDCPICSMTLVPKPKAGDVKGENAAKASMGAAPAGTAPAARADGHDHAAGATGEYYCPMHPEVTSSDPDATCDKCGGMKLQAKPPEVVVPASPAGAAAEGVPGLAPLTLSQDRIQLMGMRTAMAERGVLSPSLRTVGTVAAREKGLAVIQTRFAGWIETLNVEQSGQRVRKGQILATLYSPEILAAQEEYLNAARWAKAPDGGSGHVSALSAGLGKDARQRLELLGIGKRELDDIERSGKPTRSIAIRSPVSGYVIEKNAVQGLYIQPGTALFQVADLSTVWVTAEVYEYEIGRVKLGQTASIELASYPGETFTGKLSFIYPSVAAATRTLRVRLDVKNPGLRLKPGMYGTVNIELAQTDALLLPAEAVVDTGVMQYVFIVLPEGRFEPRKVKLGARSEGKVQVLKGLAEGETVVTTANFLLDSESHLQAAVLGDGASGGAPAAPGDFCAVEFDKQKFPAKHQQCVACRAHRGMGAMEDDCRKQIPKPWK